MTVRAGRNRRTRTQITQLQQAYVELGDAREQARAAAEAQRALAARWWRAQRRPQCH